MRKEASNVPAEITTKVGSLLHKMNDVLFADGKEGVMVTFISARSGEGTTLVSEAFARALHDEMDKNVLLITNDDTKPGIVETACLGKSLSAALEPIEPGFYRGSWTATSKGRAQSGKFIQSKEFWGQLQQEFDAVVIDAPCFQKSNDGVAYAQESNATVLVVEAEGTRKQVVEKLRETLDQAGAKIAGVVLNKRRFYIPDSVYEYL